MFQKIDHKSMVKIIKDLIDENKRKYSYSCYTPTSLPIGCSLGERLLLPDILVVKNSNITHIVELETTTGGSTIAGKILLAEEAIKQMIENNDQDVKIKPKLVFLYCPNFKYIKRIRYRGSIAINLVRNIDVDIRYFERNLDWF